MGLLGVYNLRKLKVILGFVISLVGGMILFLIFCIVMRIIQVEVFLPKENIMMLAKFPASRLIFLYEILIIAGLLYALNKNIRNKINSKYSFIKRHRNSFRYTFLATNIILLYSIFIGVTAVTKDKIIDYNFFSPYGKTYNYNDIVKINAGIYGKSLDLFGEHPKGDFYYIIELNDGAKINLTQIGGSKTDDILHTPEVIEKLDKQFVSMGISKVSSNDNIEYCTEYFNKTDTDKIKEILKSVKR